MITCVSLQVKLVWENSNIMLIILTHMLQSRTIHLCEICKAILFSPVFTGQTMTPQSYKFDGYPVINPLCDSKFNTGHRKPVYPRRGF